MTANIILETLNIWGGRVYKPLMEHVQEQAHTVDIFCFQEVYSTQSKRIYTRESTVPHISHHSTNAQPARANIYQDLSQSLPRFHGYYYSAQDRYDSHGPVDYDLSFGLALFVKKTIQVDAEGNIFVHKARNSVVGSNNATIGKNLQYIRFSQNGKQFTVANLHGLWNGQGKTDSLERIEQARKTKAF
ncbi:MAG: hypothetical protein M3Z24_14680 [Chloroflexota bacterium]|nr:hypothetical protein [Chloroflexota bacterium]